MNADVKIDEVRDTWVTVEGNVLNARTADLILDSPERRRNGGGPFRRALVHDQSDGLTVNFQGDYPGGVTLNGVKHISAKGPEQAPDRLRIRLRTVPELVIDGGIQFTWDHGQILVNQGGSSTEQVSLQSLIAHLQTQVADLTQRIAVLEGR